MTPKEEKLEVNLRKLETHNNIYTTKGILAIENELYKDDNIGKKTRAVNDRGV